MKILYYEDSKGILNRLYYKFISYQLHTVFFQDKNKLYITLKGREYEVGLEPIGQFERIKDRYHGNLTVFTLSYTNSSALIDANEKDIKGFSILLVDVIRSVTNKAIFYFNIIDEEKYITLNSRIENQLFCRLSMALFIEDKKFRVIEDNISPVVETEKEEFALEIIKLEKDKVDSPLNAWYNLALAYGLDDWSMTSSNFLPVTKSEIHEELKRYNYFEVFENYLQEDNTIQFLICVLMDKRNGDSQFFVSSESAYYGLFAGNRFY